MGGHRRQAGRSTPGFGAPRHQRWRASALTVALAVLPAAGFTALAPAGPASAVVGTAPKAMDLWAFCGVRPSDPAALETARTMAVDAGISVTMGPCNVPTSDYTPVNPANRYVSPAVYRQLVDINAAAGMKTGVYDARVWSDTKSVRDAAYEFWKPVLANIAVWDLGDEFQPDSFRPNEWTTLKHRWSVVLGDLTVRTGIKPFTNHIPTQVEAALTDLPGSTELISFDRYGGDFGASVAESLDARVTTVMCAVNTYDHLGLKPTPDSVRMVMDTLRAAGCDRFLVFGGARVYDTTQFGAGSMTDVTGAPTVLAPAVYEGSGRSSFTPVGPARLLDTRTGAPTVDGRDTGGGLRLDGQTTELQVGGRADVRAKASAVVLNVTTTNATAAGFVTVHPCGEARPNAAQVNFTARTDQATAVFAKLSPDGRACLFTSNPTDLVVDVVGFYPAGAAYAAVSPARLLDTRRDPGLATVDGQGLAGGVLASLSVTELQVAGRGGVPEDATDAALNLTATNVAGPGYVTVFPCGTRPTASHLNYVAGQTVTNAVHAALDQRGKVCLFSLAPIDLVVDVNGFDTITPYTSLTPARLFDTRPAPVGASVDGLQVGLGRLAAGSVTPLHVGGRAPVAAGAAAAVVNLTVTNAAGSGFVTMFPCGQPRPVASNLNVVARATVTNLAVSRVGSGGDVCLFTSTTLDAIVDVNGFHP